MADCPEIASLGYDAFGKELLAKAQKIRTPLSGTIELTARCNLKCAHCYINLPANDVNSEKELTTDEIKKILSEVSVEGCLWLLFTGGEPLLRKDFEEIYVYAKKRGFFVTVFTNATLIDEKIIEVFKEFPPFSIETTLYGITPETYEGVTGVKGSFKRFMNGVDLIIGNKLPLKIKSVIMSLNYKEIDEMKKWVESKGKKFRFDPVLNPRLDGKKGPEELRLLPEEVARLDFADPQRVAEWKKFSKDFIGAPVNDNLFVCSAGRNSFYIDSFGYLNVCVLARFLDYSLRKGTFKEGYYKFFPEIINKKVEGRTKCRECRFIALCGQCPGWSNLEFGNKEEPSEYLCKIANLRIKGLECI